MFKGFGGFDLKGSSKSKDDNSVPFNFTKAKKSNNFIEINSEVKKDSYNIVAQKSLYPVEVKQEIKKMTLEEVEADIKRYRENSYKKNIPSLFPALIVPKEVIKIPLKKTATQSQEKVKTDNKQTKQSSFIEVFNKIIEKRSQEKPAIVEITNTARESSKLAKEITLISKSTKDSIKGYKKYKTQALRKDFKEPLVPERNVEQIQTQETKKVEKEIETPKKITTKKEIVQVRNNRLPMVLSLIFFGLTVLWFTNSINASKSNTPNPVLGISSTEGNVSEIAYTVDGNVWLLKNNKKLQVTYEGTNDSPYENISWVDKFTLGFDRCYESQCKIYKYSIEEDILREVTIINTSKINALYWLDKNDFLVNHTENETKDQVIRITDGIEYSILNYTSNSKFNSPDDAIGFVASPDKEFYIVYNTALEGSNNFVIFNSNNVQLSELSKEVGIPTISSNNQIYFKAQNKLFRAKLDSIFSEVMIDNFYGFDEIFIDNTNILYWRNDENQIILENYSLQTQSNTKIAENIIKPQTDGTIFVGLTVVQVDGEISRKLTVFDLKGNSKVLEDENISEFKINHF